MDEFVFLLFKFDDYLCIECYSIVLLYIFRLIFFSTYSFPFNVALKGLVKMTGNRVYYLIFKLFISNIFKLNFFFLSFAKNYQFIYTVFGFS